MNHVFISIPTAIVAAIYERFKEQSDEIIIDTLQGLAGVDIANEKQSYLRPKAKTTTRRVWDIADELSYEKKQMASREEVVNACTDEGINSNTANTQYSHWKKSQQARIAGLHAGKGWVSEDFDEPLGDNFLLGDHKE